MPFNSLTFLIFCAIFFLFWPIARKEKHRRWIYVTFASLFFYGWWDWRFLFLLLGSGFIDYCSARGMGGFPKYKKFFLIASLTGNISSLFIFKYSAFIAENIDRMFLLLGYPLHLKSQLPPFTLILPIGISFYTFQSLSYTIDVYRGAMKPVRNVFHFLAFLSLFPQLLAGPIVRARDLIPQLEIEKISTEEDRWAGTKLIVGGYFKKMVLADNLAPLVNTAFAAMPAQTSSIYWWIVIGAFALQIYFDFSGYTDIARGLAKWMGYDFLVNFDHPYTSTSFREFWARWHISLSTWFRDYLYIPLGGSKNGELSSHINMWITMLLSGLWHGAAFHFIAWGGMHAFFLSFERVTRWPDRLKALRWGRSIANVLIVFQVLIAWVFFRASDISQAESIITNMLSFNNSLGFETNDVFRMGVLCLIIGVGFEGFHTIKLDIKRLLCPSHGQALEVVSMAVLVVACVFFRGPGMQFIYFQF